MIYDYNFMHKYKEYENEGFPTGHDIYYATPALELNFFLTLVSKFQELVPIIQQEYNFDKAIQVITEYPKDLTNFQSPAIVIRQVNTDDDQIMQEGTLNVIDNSTGEDVQIDLDTYSMRLNFYMQFDCVAGTKLDRLILKCIVQSCFIRLQKFPLLDFTNDYINGVPMKLDEEIRKKGDYTQWSSTHDTLKYIAIYRQNFYCKMIIVPYKNIVDVGRLQLNEYTFLNDSPNIQDILDNPIEYESHKLHYQNYEDDIENH